MISYFFLFRIIVVLSNDSSITMSLNDSKLRIIQIKCHFINWTHLRMSVNYKHKFCYWKVINDNIDQVDYLFFLNIEYKVIFKNPTQFFKSTWNKSLIFFANRAWEKSKLSKIINDNYDLPIPYDVGFIPCGSNVASTWNLQNS